uniref:hypothetical protein n=1 Tax=Pedobacter schmidteae TaxID=2201271 RepID=UPI000EAEBA75|nr:hypothetical protein [Pedobacter schmidteae]
MKRTVIQLSLLIAITLFTISCKKRNQEPKVQIDETNLTVCPDKGTCQYLFTEHADLNDRPEVSALFKTGNYRVFWSNVEYPGVTARIYIKAPMQGTSFSLNKADVLAGRVVLFTSCPTCLTAVFKPVDGYVKGINLTPEKRADQAKWLLEIKIVSRIEGSANVETLLVKQYFYPNFVID